MSSRALLCVTLVALLAAACCGLPQARQPDKSVTGHRLPWSDSAEEGTLNMPEKSEWPELVGANAEESKAQLAAETGCKVYLVETGSVITMDYRTDRIRIWYDKDTGNIVRAPKLKHSFSLRTCDGSHMWQLADRPQIPVVKRLCLEPS